MCRIRLLILLLLSLISLISCGYSFVLDKQSPKIRVKLLASENRTSLREAGMILDSHLEKTLSSMDMLSRKAPHKTMACSIISTSHRAITSTSISSDDRYRLTITVSAEIKDHTGNTIWRSRFTDQGTYAQGGQEEDALDEACEEISLQIARTVTSLQL